MAETDIEVRVAALEQAFRTLKTAQQEPFRELLDWACEERFNELGRTRGALLALKAFAQAAIAVTADRQTLAAALDAQLRIADADLLALHLPERSMPAAANGLSETAAALRRSCSEP